MSLGTYAPELLQNARRLVVEGKGILAADEDTKTIGKRFAAVDVENCEEMRRKYRQMLFQTKGIEEYISGAILYEETLYQKADDGNTFVDILSSKGILVGLEVDKGFKFLSGTDGEFVTQGIDNLDVRCREYYQRGARFAKWRAILQIKDTNGWSPSSLAIIENASTLARFASICQQNGLVPIINVEVLMKGAFSIEIAASSTEQLLAACFKALSDHHIMLEGIILKPNMVRSGSSCMEQAASSVIALATVRVLQHTVPPAVPGIAFLSGGMSEEEASLALSDINNAPGPKPWALTFSYGHALQQSVLSAWKGSDANIADAQHIFLTRAEANSLASMGKYLGGFGDVKNSVFKKGYVA